MPILGISGSLRNGSHNRRLLLAAGAALPPGVELVEWDGLAGLPAFNEDHETAPPQPVRALLAAIADADALLIATPEYNASVPGALKNALDWASRPFPDNVLRDKPCAVIGASTGLFGAVFAQAELRKTLTASGAHVLQSELPVATADSAFDTNRALADPELNARLRILLADLVREVGTPVTARSRGPEVDRDFARPKPMADAPPSKLAAIGGAERPEVVVDERKRRRAGRTRGAIEGSASS